MTIKNKQMFCCEYCDRSWGRRYEYDRHLTSVKHDKMLQKSKDSSTISKDNSTISKDCSKMTKITPEKTILTTYCCDYCQFTCNTKKEAEKHSLSKQHVRNENKEEDFLEIVNKYTCVKCDKIYDKYISCWKHSKTCKGKKENIVMEINVIPSSIVDCQVKDITTHLTPTTQLITNEENITKNIMETIVDKMMDNNKQLMEQMVNVVKTILQETKSQPSLTQNNNYTNNNSNNNYTVNMFLNEKCKDAINITDWVHQLQVDYDHLYYTGENGFQKGLTNMLVDNLNLCNIYNRPIHFTDIKRDSMYIREADEWTKHENNEKLIEVLEISARQACIRLTDWMKEHEDVPDYHNLDSELGKQYLALMMSVIRPEAVRLKAYPKVMKELAKTAKLRKEDQT